MSKPKIGQIWRYKSRLFQSYHGVYIVNYIEQIGFSDAGVIELTNIQTQEKIKSYTLNLSEDNWEFIQDA